MITFLEHMNKNHLYIKCTFEHSSQNSILFSDVKICRDNNEINWKLSRKYLKVRYHQTYLDERSLCQFETSYVSLKENSEFESDLKNVF